MKPKRWQLLEAAIPRSLDELIEILLRNRGVDSAFLQSSLADLEVHCGCCGMTEGAQLVASHLVQGHRLVLVGDYDCDGITATAQMALFLREIGYSGFEAVFPERQEGYGMPARAVLDHPDAHLFVVMDCGTRDFQSIALARERGADCLVIDHHEVTGREMAPASVVINPKQPGCPSRFKELCSSGLTLLFLARLRKALAGSFPVPSLGGKYLSLAAIGTIADLVPLVDGNRIIARSGLASLNAAPYAPLAKIAQHAGLANGTLNAGHIGFQLAPRINAAGRMASPRIAYELLISTDPEDLDRDARVLSRLNLQRQAEERKILRDIAARHAEAVEGRRALVLADPSWPLGIVGIIASRVQQELCFGPSIILSIDREAGIARGSARSIPGFDLHTALSQTSDLLLKWGGHKMAAGLTISIEKLGAFAQAFEATTAAYPEEVFHPSGRIDAVLPLELLGDALLGSLDRLEPHGYGNPRPVFAARNVRVGIQRRFGKEMSHLALTVQDGRPAVFWRGAHEMERISSCLDGPVDIAFQLDRNGRGGEPVLSIKDIGRLLPPEKRAAKSFS